MGKRGPKKRFRRSRTVKTDDDVEAALAADLAVLRAANPGAKLTVSDVMRSWSRAGNRDRHVQHESRLMAQIHELVATVAELTTRAGQLEAEILGHRQREAAGKQDDLHRARALLEKPDNVALVRLVEDLARQEAAGLEAKSSNPILQRGRRQVTRWSDLLPQWNG